MRLPLFPLQSVFFPGETVPLHIFEERYKELIQDCRNEAITFGMTQGVAPDEFLEVISQCAGTSWMLENRAPHVIAGDYTPHSAVDIWLKDLGIVLDIAKDAKFGAPLTAAALQQFVAASGSGLGREDDAAVAKVYARNANIELP